MMLVLAASTASGGNDAEKLGISGGEAPFEALARAVLANTDS